MHLASKCATLNDCSYTGDGCALPSARTCNEVRSAARNRLDHQRCLQLLRKSSSHLNKRYSNTPSPPGTTFEDGRYIQERCDTLASEIKLRLEDYAIFCVVYISTNGKCSGTECRLRTTDLRTVSFIQAFTPCVIGSLWKGRLCSLLLLRCWFGAHGAWSLNQSCSEPCNHSWHLATLPILPLCSLFF